MWDLTGRPRLPSSRRHDSPPLGCRVAELGLLERQVVRALIERGRASSGEIAAALQVEKLAVRNALRRVMRERYARRVDRGIYAPAEQWATEDVAALLAA